MEVESLTFSFNLKKKDGDFVLLFNMKKPTAFASFWRYCFPTECVPVSKYQRVKKKPTV